MEARRVLAPGGKYDEMDRRAIDCFDQALANVGLANDGALRQVLHALSFAKNPASGIAVALHLNRRFVECRSVCDL